MHSVERLEWLTLGENLRIRYLLGVKIFEQTIVNWKFDEEMIYLWHYQMCSQILGIRPYLLSYLFMHT
jgi:hypothetical protein